MRIEVETTQAMGARIHDFDLHTAADDDFAQIKKHVYAHKIVALKDQQLSSAEFIELGRRLGEIDVYYEPMYHHPRAPRDLRLLERAEGRQAGRSAQDGQVLARRLPVHAPPVRPDPDLPPR